VVDHVPTRPKNLYILLSNYLQFKVPRVSSMFSTRLHITLILGFENASLCNQAYDKMFVWNFMFIVNFHYFFWYTSYIYKPNTSPMNSFLSLIILKKNWIIDLQDMLLFTWNSESHLKIIYPTNRVSKLQLKN